MSDGWIQYYGGGMPVQPDVRVDVAIVTDYGDYIVSGLPTSFWNWKNRGDRVSRSLGVSHYKMHSTDGGSDND